MLDTDALCLPAGVAPTEDGILRHKRDVRRRLWAGKPRIVAPAVAPEMDFSAVFDGIAVGPCNAHSIRMAQRWMRGEAGNVLYIRGPAGSGKSLLLNTIRDAMNCRGMDDVGARPQQTLDALRTGEPVVLADVVSPIELADPTLAARCSAAMPLVLAPLDPETAFLALERMCAPLMRGTPGFAPGADVLHAIAGTDGITGHSLRGAAYAVLSAHLRGEPCDAAAVPGLMGDLCAPIRGDGRLRVEDVIAAVCRAYGVSRADLLSQRRTAGVVHPRQIAMYLAKRLTLRSLPEIARRMGGRDHTTVLHAVRKFEARTQSDAAFAAEMDALMVSIREGVR